MEQRMLAQRRSLGKRLPRIFLRQVDDGFFTFHKGINVDAEIPIRVRAIVDTVGWPTTGAATVISKTLSPLLKSIPTHVQVTEHAITIIEGVVLAQDEYGCVRYRELLSEL